jgi:hypothetical protein
MANDPLLTCLAAFMELFASRFDPHSRARVVVAASSSHNVVCTRSIVRTRDSCVSIATCGARYLSLLGRLFLLPS